MNDTLSQTFAALADPTRRAMLSRLSRGEASVSDLGKPFLRYMSQPAITKEFDEGYTNFRYVLADQSVAVEGAPLDTIADGPGLSDPGASSADSASASVGWRNS